MDVQNFIPILLLVMLFGEYTGATLSKPKKSKGKKKKVATEQKDLPDLNVFDRDLVTEQLSSADIIDNNAKYCKKEKDKRKFQNGEVLAYVTPWNNHGYDVAKTFGKFTMISPVWLQIKRKPRGMYSVEGTHDIDKGWMKDVAKRPIRPKILPRVLFDGWSEEDYEALFKSEDEIEAMANAIIRVLKENKMHGAVIEIWSQIGESHPKEVVHVITHMCWMFHDNELKLILVVPAGINKDKKTMTSFGEEEFTTLAPLVDYFSLMTYDFAAISGVPAPSSPLPWVRSCIEFIDPQAKYREKILTGLNFYGHMFTSKAASPIVGRQYLEFLDLYKPEISWEKSASEHYSQFGDDVTGKGIMFFPSLKSIDARLSLAKEMGTGISIWEIGQGFDYFYDVL